MLEEVLRHDKLGNKEELLFFLFEGLPAEDGQSLYNLRKYCGSNFFSISRSFNGIVDLMKFSSFISITGDQIFVKRDCFDKTQFKKDTYFLEFHFYDHLLKALRRENLLQEMFNEANTKFNPALSHYYVLESQFPYKFFPFRNLLLSLGFFYRSNEFPNHLIISQDFTSQFKTSVVDQLISTNNLRKKISLSQLKKTLENQEAAGKAAELFVLKYELKRLANHSNIEKVKIISEEYVNAGYDIEAFEDLDSIIIDKFIEVKSYKGEVCFFWSINEIDQAKELKDKYYLYLVDRSRIDNEDYIPQQFQDPYKKIFEDEMWKKETGTWKINFIE